MKNKVDTKDHPLTKIIGLFDDIPDFTNEEYSKAKKSLFKNALNTEKIIEKK